MIERIIPKLSSMKSKLQMVNYLDCFNGNDLMKFARSNNIQLANKATKNQIVDSIANHFCAVVLKH